MLNVDTDPNDLYSGTQWVRIAQNRCIQGAGDKFTTGQEIEAGLPNITGNVNASQAVAWHTIPKENKGAFYTFGSSKQGPQSNGNEYSQNGLSFDASNNNPIYGNSDTVQPPALALNIWQRIA